MAPERAKPSHLSSSSNPPPPPRTIDVQKFAESRAPELESLHAIVASRLAGDFRIRRDKRRRTTGHENRKKKRRKLGGGGGGKQEGSRGQRDAKKMSRRVRRRMEFQRNPDSGFCTSGDGTRRLRTHLWHAKRFAMVKRWGFYLPLGLQGRGRGSRAVLKWLKYEALVHDASYSLPIQLEGPEDSILAILENIFLPSPSEPSEGSSNMVTNGVCYGNAMLYHAGMPLSQLIAPVLYMWEPVSIDNGKINPEHDGDLSGQISMEQDHASNGHDIAEQRPTSPNCQTSAELEHVPDCCGTSGRSECCTSCRRLLIWIHAAAFKEGFDVLRLACQKQMHGNGVCVSCSTREGQIARLEVMGAKALEILQKILHPVSEPRSIPDDSISGHPWLTACTDPWRHKAFIFNHAEHLPSHAILSLTVHDPRESPSKKNEPAYAPSTSIQGDLQDKNTSDSNDLISVSSTMKEHTLQSLWMKPEVNCIFLSDCKNLWDSSYKQNPPLPENVLCTEKHNRRLKSFYLNSTDDAFPSIKAKEDFSTSCPILLLKHANPGNNFMGWSIILPLSWAKPFWISLVTHGARAIGLRERKWIASNNGLSSFPFDFPDCEAYTSFMADEAAEFEKTAELRPLAVRPMRVPLPPPWDCVTSTVKKGVKILSNSQTLDVQCSDGVATATSSVSLDNGNCQPSSSSDQHGASFPGFVARTSKVLIEHLAKISERQLLLFPNMRMVEKGFFKLIENDRHNWVTEIANLVHTNRELCFVRVLLRACKEGVFEEGAIVCAPVGTDLSQWTSRSEEEEEHIKLQVPTSFIGSCFAQQDSGKWELQVPEDSANYQTFRWPIGFVTSGFVHRSTKPVAVAFCEAKLLAMLRGQQWNQIPTLGPDIFVLVRNLKSSAYRRALATVVLEQQKDDVEFM